MDECEWGFDTPPDGVDFERIWQELDGRPAIQCYAYMGQLKQNAPKTFALMGQWARAQGKMTWCRFDEPEVAESKCT